MDKTISVIVSAYNEEDHIQNAVTAAQEIFSQTASDYELLIFNDGSHDQTGAIADRLAAQSKHIRVIHFSQNQGLAEIAKEGIRLAGKNYITWFPADDSIRKESIRPIIESIGSADIILAYMTNCSGRTPLRKFLSHLYTQVMNTAFGLRVKYFNGPSIYPASILKSLAIKSTGHVFFSEILIRSIKSGKTYYELPFEHNAQTDQRSKSLTLRNVLSVVQTFRILVNDVYLLKKPLG